MGLSCTSVVLLLLLVPCAEAQTLQHRQPPVAGAPPGSAAPADATDPRQALPLAAEGEYRWGQAGEVIELYVENGRLRGYLTRRSEHDHADSAPMTFAFAEAGATGQTLRFRTRHIHGDWYSFAGQVARGAAADRRSDGQYLLQGALSFHLGASRSDDTAPEEQPVTSQVSLKLSGSKGHAE